MINPDHLPGSRQDPMQTAVAGMVQTAEFPAEIARDTKQAGGLSRRGVLAAALGLGVSAPAVLRAANREWTLTAMEDFPPYNYQSAGKLVGIDVDIMNEAALRLGVHLKMVPLPWPRAILSFETGGVDGIFQVSATSYRFLNWHLTGPMRLTRLVFAVLADSSGTAGGAGGGRWAGRGREVDLGEPVEIIGDYDIRGLTGETVGVVNGFTYSPAFDTAQGFRREGSKDDLTSLRKLLLGRVSMVLGGEANLRFAARQLGVTSRIRLLSPSLGGRPRYIGFRRDAAGSQKAGLMQAALSEMWTEGSIDAILARHGER